MLNFLKWKLFSFKRVLNFVDTHPDEIEAIVEMEEDVDNLRQGVAAIETAEGIQVSSTTGVTEDAQKKKKAMAQTIIQMARKALPLARKADKLDFVEELNHRITYINKAPKADALARARKIMQLLADNTTLFTNIKPADITKMQDSIKVYDEAQVNPIALRDIKKVDGTEAIFEEVKKADSAAENIYDFFYGYYQQTNPELVEKLAECLGIEEEGIKHTGINAICIDANPPEGAITHLLQGVQIKIVELNLTALSDINGMCHISKFKPGTYHVEFSKEGFVTKPMIINFKRGRMLDIEVQMMRTV